MKSSRRRRRRWIRRCAILVGIIGGLYIGILLAWMFRQRSTIYQPAIGSRESIDRRAKERGYAAWLDHNDSRIGFHRPSKQTPARFNILLTHGNAGSAVGRDHLLNPLQAAIPANVWILEYPGFADRPGPISQVRLLRAAEEAWAELPKDLPIVLVGESLGSGVASYLASLHSQELHGLFLFTPFDNLSAVVQSHFPWVPAKWLLWDRYPSDEWLKQYPGPLGAVVPDKDPWISPVSGRRLFEGYTGPKRLWELPGSDPMQSSERPPEWWTEAFEWLAQQKSRPESK